jgi:hypothetical protein
VRPSGKLYYSSLELRKGVLGYALAAGIAVASTRGEEDAAMKAVDLSRAQRARTKVDDFSFGRVRVDGEIYEHDVVLAGGKVSKRRKKPSKRFRDQFGHTPLSLDEDIPWSCERLIVGTGAYGNLPIMADVTREAERRGVELVVLPTALAIDEVNHAARSGRRTNAILHVTC